MARKLVPLNEAATQLGLSPDELNEMRQNGDIYGYRDGASWKFKPEDIEKLAEERAARAGGAPADSAVLPSDSSDEGDDMVLLSEVELGASASTSSTVIGKPGKGQSPEDSDIKLAIDSAKREMAAPAHHDSDVLPVDVDDDLPVNIASGSQLDLSNPAAHSDSATQLQLGGAGAPGEKASSSDLTLSLAGGSDKNLGGPGSDLTLGGGSDKNLGGPGSDLTLGGGSGVISGPGSDLSLGESPESDVFSLQQPGKGSSKVRLGGEEASVLDSPGSGTGSDITISPGDSGISLLDPSDSGLSLEQPLELSSADDESSFDLSSDSSGTLGDSSSDFDSDAVMELKGEDDFLLTPLEEAGDDESQDSGSQVIALDSDTGDFDDAAPTMLGDAGAPAATGLLEEDLGAGLGGGFGQLGTAAAGGLAPSVGVGPGMVMAPAAAETSYGVLTMVMLSFGTLFLAITGMMMFDVVRNVWSFDSPYGSSSFLMDSILSLFE